LKKTRKRSRLREVWRQLRKNKLAVVALIVLVLLFLVALFAPVIAPHPYEQQHSKHTNETSSAEFPLGTDKLGRCVLSRLIYGSRQSLTMGLLSVGFAAVIGVAVGSIAGYFGGWTDNLVMRVLDIYQSIPMFLLCVTLAAVLGPSLRNAIIALAFGLIPLYARISRAMVLTVREKEYIEAARSKNAKNSRIIIRHIIPNTMAPIIVEVTMGMGSAILAGAALSFIGIGAQPPIPEWGAMISDARSVMREYPALALYPGLCIMITSLSLNLLGDGLRDALDPRLKN
jgi:peptide/nickel transport system permease protein